MPVHTTEYGQTLGALNVPNANSEIFAGRRNNHWAGGRSAQLVDRIAVAEKGLIKQKYVLANLSKILY